MPKRDWMPSAALPALRRRGEILQQMRQFFERRAVLEVETPILSAAACVERQIDSMQTRDGAWLSTSPEFAMKRLLAAGSGPIFQLARVFRVDECGRWHNPEFTMLEWYRPDFTLTQLMDEVEALLHALGVPAQACARISYCELLARELAVDALRDDAARIREALRAVGQALPERYSSEEGLDRDFWLDLAMGAYIGPRLGTAVPLFVYDYPPSQAALARVRGQPPVAARFELYWQGVELANGFHELTDAAEQRARFVADQAWRRQHGRTVPPIDECLLQALAHGMPECSGVALGVDRLVMLLLGATSIAEVMAFDHTRA